jgi:putative hemolysin
MFELVVIFACLIINALLSALEMAIMTASSSKLKSQAATGDVKAKKVLELKGNPERVLSVLQIGITLVGAISAAIGGAGAEENIAPFFEKFFGLSEEVSESLAIISIVIPLTYFSVVLGELVPKTFALKFPLTIAKFGAGPLRILDRVFHPVVFVLEISTKFLCRLFSSSTLSERTGEHQASIEIDGLTDTHKQYVLNLLGIDKRRVKDVMLPWIEVVKIDFEADDKLVLEMVKQSGHTRIPVCHERKIVGILHSKEFIASDENSRNKWNQLLRPIQTFKESEPVLNALKVLQGKGYHMGIVFRDQEPVGVITIEDILEEIVGDIFDEDDQPRSVMSLTAQLRSKNLVRE